MPDTTPKLTPQHAEMLALSVLSEGASYGYAVAKQIAARSDQALKLPPSQLYPLMTRLEKQGLVTTDWEEVKAAETNEDAPGRRRKWYTLSAKGRKRLDQRIEAHRRFTRIIETFLPATDAERSPA